MNTVKGSNLLYQPSLHANLSVRLKFSGLLSPTNPTPPLPIKRTFNTQFCRIKGCGGAGWPPPIIFERLKLPQQIIYFRKGNLSESPNHFKYLENILISRFYEQFSRSSQNLGYFGLPTPEKGDVRCPLV